MKSVFPLTAALVSVAAASAAPAWQQTLPAPPRPAAAAKPAIAAPAFVKPRLLWKTFLRRVDGTPAALPGVIFIGAGSYLHQLDEGGRTLWATETGNQQSSPALDETRVYIGSDRGILYALNQRTGQGAWKFAASPRSVIQTRPVVGGGLIFTEASDNNVYALDAVSGAERWRFTRTDGSLSYSSPIYTRTGLYVGGENTLYRLDPQTGAEMWRAPLGGKSLSTATVGGRRVFAGGDGIGLNALSEEDGKALWNFTGKARNDWFGPPLYAAGTVFVTTYSRYVYAVDSVSGRQKWSARVLGAALARPVLDEKRGVLYVTSTTFKGNPTLSAFDARSGKLLWSYKMGYVAGSPVIEGDRLYVGSTTGHFYAFSLK